MTLAFHPSFLSLDLSISSQPRNGKIFHYNLSMDHIGESEIGPHGIRHFDTTTPGTRISIGYSHITSGGELQRHFNDSGISEGQTQTRFDLNGHFIIARHFNAQNNRIGTSAFRNNEYIYSPENTAGGSSAVERGLAVVIIIGLALAFCAKSHSAETRRASPAFMQTATTIAAHKNVLPVANSRMVNGQSLKSYNNCLSRGPV